MTSPFEDLIRATLSDLAEEAPPVQSQLIPAERRARNRRRTTMALGAAGTIAAVLVAAPFAIASTRSDAPRPAAPVPASGSFDPSARPSPRGSTPPAPSPAGPDASPPQPALPSPAGNQPDASLPSNVPSPAAPSARLNPPAPPAAHRSPVPSISPSDPAASPSPRR